MGLKELLDRFFKSQLTELAFLVWRPACRKFRQIRRSYPDPNLTDADQRFALHHLNQCPSCAEYDATLDGAMTALRRAVIDPPRPITHEGCVRRIVNQLSIHPKWGIWRPALIAATCAAAVVSLFVHWVSSLTPGDNLHPQGSAKMLDGGKTAEPVYRVPPEPLGTRDRADG